MFKKWRRPDDDPLQVTPHERFERATMRPGELAPYEIVIQKMAKPCIVQAGAGDIWSVQQVIYRIAWAYSKRPAQVEGDLHLEGQRQLHAAVERARAAGTIVVQG